MFSHPGPGRLAPRRGQEGSGPRPSAAVGPGGRGRLPPGAWALRCGRPGPAGLRRSPADRSWEPGQKRRRVGCCFLTSWR